MHRRNDLKIASEQVICLTQLIRRQLFEATPMPVFLQTFPIIKHYIEIFRKLIKIITSIKHDFGNKIVPFPVKMHSGNITA